MNDKTIQNIKETLNQISGNDENYYKLLSNILDIELKNISDQEKNNSITTLIELYIKGDKIK